MALARLRNVDVLEMIASVISNLVEGEFMQLRNSGKCLGNQSLPKKYKSSDVETHPDFKYYIEKTFLKTASLIAKACRASAILGNASLEASDAAYNYGRNFGIAFQLVDDMLDFVVSQDQFGKPVNADLSLGLATAPVLFAAQQFPELLPMISRKFNQPNDASIVY